MGRFAEKTTREQREACAIEVLDRGRTRADVARHGIPGILPPGHISEAAVGDYVKKEQNRRRPPIGRAGVAQAGENIHRRALELADTELRKIEDQRSTRDLERIKQLQDIATKAIRAVTPGKPPADKPTTKTKDKPNTLASRLANGQPKGNGETRDVQGDEGKPAGANNRQETECENHSSNGADGVQSKARAAELLNHPVANSSL